MKSHTILNPGTMGNPHPVKFLCEVREGSAPGLGFLVDFARFETRAAADDWGKNHGGDMSKKVAEIYVSIEESKARGE